MATDPYLVDWQTSGSTATDITNTPIISIDTGGKHGIWYKACQQDTAPVNQWILEGICDWDSTTQIKTWYFKAQTSATTVQKYSYAQVQFDNITYSGYCNTECKSIYFPLTPQERIKEILRQRRFPNIQTRLGRFGHARLLDVRETRARDTLRSVIGDQRYRRFLRDGFVSVTNPVSGRRYQIPSNSTVKVFENGQQIDSLCILLKGNFTPADRVITLYLLALNNEARLWKMGNRGGPPYKIVQPKVETRNLVEMFKEFKSQPTNYCDQPLMVAA